MICPFLSILCTSERSQIANYNVTSERRWTVLPPYRNICNNLLLGVSAHKYMLPCIQQLLLKPNAECCAGNFECCCMVSLSAGCGCCGLFVGAAECLRGCCGYLPVLQDMAAYTVKKVIDFPVPPHSPAGMSCHKLNSPWPGTIKLVISVGF